MFGYCLRQRNNVAQTSQALDAGMLEYVPGLVGTGDYPALSDLIDRQGSRSAWDQIEAHQRDTRRFDRNLDRLLDGLAHSLAD